MDVAWWAWAGLGALIVVLLAIDLVGFALREGEIPLRHAAIASIGWTVLGLVFGMVIWAWQGPRFGGEYLTGFVLEKSLSVDNLFVFALIFRYFAIPPLDQRKVMFWGIVGAIVMRGVFIVLGAALLSAFSWMIYVFGGFLILTGIRMGMQGDAEPDPENNRLLKTMSRVIPLTNEREGRALVIRREGRRVATPLFGALVMVAVFDAVFALDSIPAIFGVTREVFLVASANAFSLLGLSALYFTLVRMMERFRHLTAGVAVVLVIVGIKMVTGELIHTPEAAWLVAILIVLGTSVVLSMRSERAPTG
ncbi:MAG TPA: TerC/Alx family metal homeostasis membrane protein [Thermoleophilaceae bacterium]|nr:TerC/Alx family metal homeostasis membrane protein [Thermoleophilaceae bacterium]